jgi:hypothetical protein
VRRVDNGSDVSVAPPFGINAFTSAGVVGTSLASRISADARRVRFGRRVRLGRGVRAIVRWCVGEAEHRAGEGRPIFRQRIDRTLIGAQLGQRLLTFDVRARAVTSDPSPARSTIMIASRLAAG